jgi:hypothetical protein
MHPDRIGELLAREALGHPQLLDAVENGVFLLAAHGGRFPNRAAVIDDRE